MTDFAASYSEGKPAYTRVCQVFLQSNLQKNRFKLIHRSCRTEYIKIETPGEILAGEYKNWFIFIEDDYKNTGGYLILLFNSPDRLKSPQGYDYWAEDESALEEMLKEAKWEIQWLEKESS